jgi:hypothetical protein
MPPCATKKKTNHNHLPGQQSASNRLPRGNIASSPRAIAAVRASDVFPAMTMIVVRVSAGSPLRYYYVALLLSSPHIYHLYTRLLFAACPTPRPIMTLIRLRAPSRCSISLEFRRCHFIKFEGRSTELIGENKKRNSTPRRRLGSSEDSVRCLPTEHNTQPNERKNRT